MTKIGLSPWQHLFERLVGELLQLTSPDWELQTNTLDPKVYYDVGRFEAERRGGLSARAAGPSSLLGGKFEK